MGKWRAALYFKVEGQYPKKYRLHWAGRCKNGKWKAKLGFWGAMSGTQFWVDYTKMVEVPLGWRSGDEVPQPNVIPAEEEPAAEDILAGDAAYAADHEAYAD